MNKLKLDKLPLKKWINNLLLFLTIPLSLYLVSVIGVVATPDHVFKLVDLVPSEFVKGGIVLWGLNTALDYLRKLRA